MSSNLFINEFLTIGFNDYFYAGNKTSFESHIIECLKDIYGVANLKDVYDRKDENGFYNLVTSYGNTSSIYNRFLQHCVEFEEFKRTKASNIKTNLGSYIEIIIIKLFLRKYVNDKPTSEELIHFENDLMNGFDTIKWHLENSINPNRTREEWNSKKNILANNVTLKEIKPEYLDRFTYAKYGIDLGRVKEMDYRMVNELNNYIKKREQQAKENVETIKKAPISLNTAISTGNGFVDALLIVSIIATEMSVGLIYLFLHL